MLIFADGAFPGFHNARKSFYSSAKTCAFRAGVQLLPPPSFEGGRFRVEIEFNHTADLQQKAEAVMSMANNGLLQDMVEKT